MDDRSAPPQMGKTNGEKEQLFKGQPPSAEFQCLFILWKMDVFIGISDAAQVVFLTDLIRQGIRQNIHAGIQALTDGAGENQLADAGG